jgi:hypothetical protein
LYPFLPSLHQLRHTIGEIVVCRKGMIAKGGRNKQKWKKKGASQQLSNRGKQASSREK